MSQHVDLEEIVRALSKLLGRFAEPTKGLPGADPTTGVRFVRFADNETDFALEFCTHDDIQVGVRCNASDILREGRGYLEATLRDVIAQLGTHRANRRESNLVEVITKPSQVRQAVSGALH